MNIFKGKTERDSGPKLKRPDEAMVIQIQEQLEVLRKPPEPKVIGQLKALRDSKVERAKQLDLEILALDEEIQWLERHPEGERILGHVLERIDERK